MNKLTKNFNFISKSNSFLYDKLLNLEKFFSDEEYSKIIPLAIEIAEYELNKNFQFSGNFLDKINQFSESYGIPVVVDALYFINKWIKNTSNDMNIKEKMNFTNGLYILKSLSMLLQWAYKEEPEFKFSNTPYNKNSWISENKEFRNSISSSELNINKSNLYNWFTQKHLIFSIPFYQRRYTWGTSNLEDLFEDISNRRKDGFQHYFGVIAIKKDLFANDNIEFKIIDGQQRITTSLIFLRAAYDLIKEKNPMKITGPLIEIFDNSNIENRYINLSAKKGEIEEFKRILSGRYIKSKINWNYGRSYNFFKEKLINFPIEKINSLVFTFISKFNIAELSYDIKPNREMDIFQNMNSKGTELKEWDLIRNQIFNMIEIKDFSNLKKVQELDNEFVHNFISNWDDKKNYLELSNFFKEFIYLKIILGQYQAYVSKEKFPIYFNFKEMYKNTIMKSEKDYLEFLYDIKKYSVIYKSLVDSDFSFLSSDDSDKLKHLENRWKNISQKNQIYPVVFSLFIRFCEWNGGKWWIQDEKSLKKGIKLVDSILIRLEVAKGFGHSFRNNSLKMAKIILEEESLENMIKKIKELYKTEEKVNTFIIEDNVFSKFLMNGEIKIQLVRKMLFEINKFLIDKNGYGLDLSLRKPSLEHVMPQNYEKWKKELSQIDNWNSKFFDHLNLLGNFYLIPKKLNSKISNDIFQNKKNNLIELKTPMIMGDKENNITSLDNIENWTFEIISSRTVAIVNLLVNKIYYI